MIFDGHNDLLLRLWHGEEPRHLRLEHAAEAGFVGGLFAVYVPSEPFPEPQAPYAVPLPLPPPLEQPEARRVALEIAARIEQIDVRLVRSASELTGDGVAAVLHLEGADPLAPDCSDLDEWFELGVRSIGLVWSRPNAFAEGVPFVFPGTPDTGPGLTPAGRRLVQACNERGIVVDCAHLNRKGFFDVAGLSDAPLVVSHSNVHAISASSRNLDDEQLDQVGASGGLVGINFAVAFLREDGRNDPDTPLETICRHVDHVCERIGPEHVAFGSDFEGATISRALGGVEGLPALEEALRARGYAERDLELITHGNWLRVLARTLR